MDEIAIRPHNIEKGMITSLVIESRVYKTWPISVENWNMVKKTIRNHIEVRGEWLGARERYEESKTRIDKLLKPINIIDTAQITINRLQDRIRETKKLEESGC